MYGHPSFWQIVLFAKFFFLSFVENHLITISDKLFVMYVFWSMVSEEKRFVSYIGT